MKHMRPIFTLTFILLSLPPLLSAQPCVPPIAADDAIAIDGKPILLDVLTNDVEPDGQLMTPAVEGGGTCDGTVTVDFGALRFDPAPGGWGQCTIRYRVFDEDGDSDTATVHVTLRPIFFDRFETGDLSGWDECVPACP